MFSFPHKNGFPFFGRRERRDDILILFWIVSTFTHVQNGPTAIENKGNCVGFQFHGFDCTLRKEHTVMASTTPPFVPFVNRNTLLASPA